MIRATYRPYNGLDELESPTAVCFTNNGQNILTGGFRTDRMLQIFDVCRPGREASSILKMGKTRRSKDGQKGLVSALASSCSNSNILAVGTYSPGSIYLYDLRAQSTPAAEIVISGNCVVGHGQSHSRKRKHFVDPDEDDLLNFSAAKVKWYQSRARSGVTQLEFSNNDYQFLYSASRRSNAILQWDLRRLSSSSFCPGIASYETDSDTNQRLEFAVKDDYIWVGGRDKCIRVYNQKKSGKELFDQLDIFPDAVNGVSLASIGEKTLLAAACGSRHFPSDEDWDKEDPHQPPAKMSPGSLRLLDVKMPSLS